MKIFKCLYTSQKQKKRKTWQDGILRFYEKDARCDLYNSHENYISLDEVLGSRMLSKQDVNKFSGNLSFDLELENYIVSVNTAEVCESSIKTTDDKIDHVVSKRKKFKVPSALAPILATDESTIIVNPPPKSITQNSFQTKGLYTVTDDELDDIWSISDNKGNEKLSNLESNIPENKYDNSALDDYSALMNSKWSSSPSNSVNKNNINNYYNNNISDINNISSASSIWDFNSNNNNNNINDKKFTRNHFQNNGRNNNQNFDNNNDNINDNIKFYYQEHESHNELNLISKKDEVEDNLSSNIWFMNTTIDS